MQDKSNGLWWKVLIGLFLGILFGLLLGPANLFPKSISTKLIDFFAMFGDIFIRLLKMIVMPLIFSSIVLGVISSGSKGFLKKIGPRALIYYTFTTLVAVLIGFFVAFLIKPGIYVDGRDMDVSFESNTVDMSLTESIASLVTDNPLKSAVENDMLAIVIFSLLVGVACLSLDDLKINSFKRLLETIQQICLEIVNWAMIIAPIAVFGLIVGVVAKIGLDVFRSLLLYVFTVLLGLGLLVGFYSIILILFTNKRPYSFFNKISNVMLFAFSTSSSGATMPLSMKTAKNKLNIKYKIYNFIIPIGSTINMDGTALYQSVATIFLAQVYGIHLSFFSLLTIVFVTIGASIGAPSVPGVGIIILAMILESVGIPGAGIALILGVDRILDMCRSSVNVTGDLTACAFFDDRIE